eukprot:355993-Chlamydomonas_euryale.AAC.10
MCGVSTAAYEEFLKPTLLVVSGTYSAHTIGWPAGCQWEIRRVEGWRDSALFREEGALKMER